MKTIELTVDVMFAKNIPFVRSLGKNVKFTTIKNVVYRKAATLLKALLSIKILYKNKNIFIKNYTWTTNLRCYEALYKTKESPSTLP